VGTNWIQWYVTVRHGSRWYRTVRPSFQIVTRLEHRRDDCGRRPDRAHALGFVWPPVPTSTSRDGRYIVIQVSGDPDGVPGLRRSTLVYGIANHIVAAVSATPDGQLVGGDTTKLNECFFSSPSMSSDGADVAFVSSFDGIVPSDTNHRPDVFVRHFDPSQVGSIEQPPAGVETASIVGPIGSDGLHRALRISP
jgi:hypothetical protein